MPAALPPFRVTAVLGGDSFGGNDAGSAEHVFQCTGNAFRSKLDCC